MKEQFKVRYLKHSLLEDCKEINEVVSKSELISLLEGGMITVISAELVR